MRLRVRSHPSGVLVVEHLGASLQKSSVRLRPLSKPWQDLSYLLRSRMCRAMALLLRVTRHSTGRAAPCHIFVLEQLRLLVIG